MGVAFTLVLYLMSKKMSKVAPEDPIFDIFGDVH